MTASTPAQDWPICGVWIAPEGKAHLALATPDGGRVERVADFRPFAWLQAGSELNTAAAGIHVEELSGDAVFNRLMHADDLDTFSAAVGEAREGAGVDVIRPWENQYLLQARRRLFEGMSFAQLRRCQLDIETGATGEGAFSDPHAPGDRILAIGLQFGERQRLLVLEAETDEAERALLVDFNRVLAEEDPDVIEGHNLFKFDFEYLKVRAKRYRVPCQWGRFGQKAGFRNSRLKVAERWIDFTRCDLPGRTIVDTFFLAQLYDISTRELTSFGLKEVAVYFGVTDDDADETGARTYIEGGEIGEAFRADRARFLAYLADDLRETKGLADLLLPTYVEQARSFPILLQDATLRGTAGKIDLLFLEKYYHARRSCPAPPEVRAFEGGYTRSFQDGVYRHVLHFDVASLYPSLLLQIGRNPRADSLGVFMPLLRELREYRLKFKQLARTAETADLRVEYHARQANFKILINSFYGYLGFSGARFGDGELAAEVTRRGRELLQALIDAFAGLGCTILEADTDGIYLSSDRYFEKPEELLAAVGGVLPPGIDLEYDGRFEAMFCYKAKNYALFDGKKITIRGSALRSRGIEPYLKHLGTQLIRFLVGAEKHSPVELLEAYRQQISARTMAVRELAKSETLSMNPDAYERLMQAGGKPRRASAEAALKLVPRPRMGDRVTYYITPKEKGRTTDWQRARPLSQYDAVSAPYDPEYYLKKLEDWVERYGQYLGIKATEPAAGDGEQGELAF